MRIPSSLETLASGLETRADHLQAQRHFDEALRLRDLARDIRRAMADDQEELLSAEHAVLYSRGYSEAYLRRTLTNYGSRHAPLFRKGDVPRHPIQRAASRPKAA